MKRFALIGAAGYIAPRHMKAIAESGNDLVAAMDHSDSVGVLDKYFPKAAFFTEFERFDRYLNKLKSKGEGIDFISVCTPNYLHDAHIRFGLRLGANVICEKPIVLNPWNFEVLKDLEKETGKKVYTILQLRLHPAIQELKKEIDNSEEFFNVDLSYITSRGNWYYASWKGSDEKSGGVATNIGIHFFDLMSYLFGDCQSNDVHLHTHDRASGVLSFKNAAVKWFLSINTNTLPENNEGPSFRNLEINGKSIDLSYNFEKLHTLSYLDVLEGRGFELDSAAPSIHIASEVRNSEPIGVSESSHPMAHLKLDKHPFKL